jgi:hypothetical protein
MRRALAIAAAASALAVPGVAYPCGSSGGGGGGGGSSSGGGGGGSSSSDSSSSSSAPACVDTTLIVGRAECHRFGQGWNIAWLPRLQIGFGFSTHLFPTDDMRFEGTAAHDTGDIAYAVVGGDMESDRAGAVTVDLRITGSVGHRGYVGVEGNVGGGFVEQQRILGPEGNELEPGIGLYASGGVVGGVALPFGDNRVRAEALVGRRLLVLTMTSYHGDCVDTQTVHDGAWLVEPRVAIERFVTPWTTVGVSLGSNLLDQGDVSAGIYLQGHVRAYDAQRSR